MACRLVNEIFIAKVSISNKLFRSFSTQYLLYRAASRIYKVSDEPEDFTGLKTYDEVMKERGVGAKESPNQVNIGFAKNLWNKEKWRNVLKEWKKKRQAGDMELAATFGNLEVDLDLVRQLWVKDRYSNHVKAAAEHYNVYLDLFGDAFFFPVVPLHVAYPTNEDDVLTPVYRGNIIGSNLAQQIPEVVIDSRSDVLWTLIMTSPDSNVFHPQKEFLGWAVSNISERDVLTGDVWCPYLQPIPCRDTGFHRYIFILYAQERRIDVSSFNIQKCNDFLSRTFSTYDFYKSQQDVLTPCGLSFFQASWDISVRNVFHHVLDLPEPIYSYEPVEPMLKEQSLVPHREPFNIYLDKYRDRKDIKEEILKEKLKETNPFAAPKQASRFPNIYPVDTEKYSSWLRDQITDKRLKIGKYVYWKEDK